MKNPDELNKNNFWFGFFFGGLSAATVLFAFGTQDGRDKLRKILEYVEDSEFDMDKLTDLVSSLGSFSEEETREAILPPRPMSVAEKLHKKTENKSQNNNLASVIMKMQDISRNRE
jgi:hypothetical protein